MPWTIDNPLRLNLWSGPRNVSTALMYSFAERPDTQVLDEPLYAHYLRLSGADHPGREEVLAAQSDDGNAIVRKTLLGPVDKPVFFCKQMAHHLPGLELGFLRQTCNVILTRDPREVLPTLSVQLGTPTLRDTGYEEQVKLLRASHEGVKPAAVLDSKALLKDPEGVLTALCEALDIAFDPSMLAWRAGAREFDGVWAPYWYHNVHRSTGFIPYRPKTDPFPDELLSLLAQCQPLYEELCSAAIKPRFSAN